VFVHTPKNTMNITAENQYNSLFLEPEKGKLRSLKIFSYYYLIFFSFTLRFNHLTLFSLYFSLLILKSKGASH
jgi:hypothetical protein